jgi:hypothetical protein
LIESVDVGVFVVLFAKREISCFGKSFFIWLTPLEIASAYISRWADNPQHIGSFWHHVLYQTFVGALQPQYLVFDRIYLIQ